jgi:dipeptidyl aminopeptidase/acylaminoacyl peptidase
LTLPACDRGSEAPPPDTEQSAENGKPPIVVEKAPAPTGADVGEVEVELESTYRKPAIEVVKIVDAKPTPRVSLSPDEKRMLMMSYPSLPGIDLLSEAMLRLAGERINPERNATQRTRYYDGLTLVTIEGGAKLELDLTGKKAVNVLWSPDSQHLAFLSPTETGMELWVADVTVGKLARVGNFHVNDTLDDAVAWQSDSKGLIVRTIVSPRKPRPVAAPVPPGPTITETSGREATNRTYQDLLTNRVDEAQFEHYFTSQLVQVALDGKTHPLGEPGIISRHEPSPDGKWLLVRRLEGPWSYSVPWWRFGHRLEARP